MNAVNFLLKKIDATFQSFL